MDKLTFVSSVVSSVAWPLVAVFFLWQLRPYIIALAERVEEISLPGGGKAKFVRVFEAAREDAEELDTGDVAPQPAEAGQGLEEAYLNFAYSFPEAAVMQSFIELEKFIMAKRDVWGAVLGDTARHPNRVVDALASHEYVEPSWVKQFNRLRRIRNYAAHGLEGNKVSPGEAIEFREMCRQLTDRLDRAFQQMRDRGE